MPSPQKSHRICLSTIGQKLRSSAPLKWKWQERLVPHNNCRCLMMLSPDIQNGSTFSVSVDGNSSEDFTVSQEQNVFKLGWYLVYHITNNQNLTLLWCEILFNQQNV